MRITNEAYKDMHDWRLKILFFFFFSFLRGTVPVTEVRHHFPKHLTQLLIEQLVLSLVPIEVIVDDVFELLQGDALFLDVIELCLEVGIESRIDHVIIIIHQPPIDRVIDGVGGVATHVISCCV